LFQQFDGLLLKDLEGDRFVRDQVAKLAVPQGVGEYKIFLKNLNA